MEDEEEEKPARNGREASPEVSEAEAEPVGLNAILVLLMSRVCQASGAVLPPLPSLVAPRRLLPPEAGAEHGEATDAGLRSRAPLARSFQKAEALLRHCLSPSIRRLFPPRASESAYDSEEDDLPGGLALLERSFVGLSRCLCVQENPRTETFQGHVRQAIPDVARGAFTYHVARTSVARHCATLHALLQHRHHLRLSRYYSCRLKAASDFVGHLMMLQRCLLQPQGRQGISWGRLLQGLCEEMRIHMARWGGLQRRLRGDPWLRSLLLQRHEAVRHMKRALSLLVLLATRLLEGCVEALLRSSTRDTQVGAALPSDLFQGLETYNQLVSDRALHQVFEELQGKPGAASHLQSSAAFPVERVLRILAAERGSRAAQRLYPLLCWQQAGPGALETVPCGDSAEPHLLEEASQALQAGEGLASLSAELQALCQEEEAALLLVLGQLGALADSLWHHVLNRPKQEQPLPHREPAGLPESTFAAAASALYVQYYPFLWKALAFSLGHQLELRSPLAWFQEGTGAFLGQQLSQAVARVCPPQECAEEVMGLALRLLARDTCQQWDQGFCRALGSSLTDRCLPGPARRTEEACSQTAQLLQGLFPPLAVSLRSLDTRPAERAADCPVRTGFRLQLLSLLVATAHISCYWVMSRAYQYLASWSLNQFLLVSQGDLQLLEAETRQVSGLVSTVFPERQRNQQPLGFHQEQELSWQVRSTASSIQLFSNDVLKLFSADCKRMSAEIFSQTMPLGKPWRLPLRTELPASPSEYASAAAQSVLGQVLQSIQLLPQDARVPALSQVTTAFLEAWMDHILAQKIKFSLQGALQLKQDFDVVRELLRSEEYGLSPEIRQLVLSLRVFQQADSAVSCLLQQPSKSSLPSPTWEAFHTCCSSDGIRTQDGGPGSLNSLESLEGLPAQARAVLESQLGDLLSHLQGAGCSPESYLSPMAQEWLALRLHGGRRWKGLALPCMKRTSEP